MALRLGRKKKIRADVLGAVTKLGYRSGSKAVNAAYNKDTAEASGYPIIDGPHYIDVLAGLHARVKPEWYFEIGTLVGSSLKQASCNFVSVDPEYKLREAMTGDARRRHFFQMTSDDFFATEFLQSNSISPDLSFLDGMHLFEYLLRDFINTEKSITPGATIVMHDCLPSSDAMEAREWVSEDTVAWTGDVWKVLSLLLELRPDLKIEVLDAWPTGLVVISNLDPASRVLSEAYDDQVARMQTVRLGDFGVDQYFGGFEIQSNYEAVGDGR